MEFGILPGAKQTPLLPFTMIFLLFFVAFIVGMILSFVSQGETSDGNQWLDTSLLYLRYGEINYIDVLFYVLKKRLSALRPH